MLRAFFSITSAFLIIVLLTPASFATTDDEQLLRIEVEKYLTGKFNPARHAAFVKVPSRYSNRPGHYLRQETLDAFKKMHKVANKEGIRLTIISATRNFNYQKQIWERKWRAKRNTIKNPKKRALNILRYNSMPGTSRHHWGTEIDLNALNNRWFESGKGLKVFKWLNKNAAKYGFHRPYTTKNSQRPHGYSEEKWHWSYTPLSIPMIRDAATALKETSISGFSGSHLAQEIGIVKHYILGVSESCR